MDSMEIDDDIYINHNLTMDGLTNRGTVNTPQTQRIVYVEYN